MVKQKHFIDIQHIREDATELKDNNIKGFDVGDHILIQTKYDGSNASCRIDPDTGHLVAFSHRHPLSYDKTLSGFWNYIEILDATYRAFPNTYVVFGEWTGQRNKIIYDKEYTKTKHWIVYDIYDTQLGSYLPQSMVKEFCDVNNLEYIEVKYDGPFISWEHCKSFMNDCKYGERNEGIIVKNQSKLNDVESRHPAYLKIVNSDFKESMKMREKPPVDPEVEEQKKYAESVAESIVTKARIEKMLFKLRDEEILPEKLTPEDMKTVARNLPKRIYEDCVKEEKELVMAAGEYFSKACNNLTMKIARDLICK